MFDRFFSLFSHDIGIDLGTANTLVWVKGKGIVIREPSVVALHKKTKKVIAIGTEAKRMVGKTPATLETVRPLRHGVISDFDATAAMISYYIQQVHELTSFVPKSFARPTVVIGIPSAVTEVERRAVWEAALNAGARVAYLIEEPMAAAIGEGISVFQPTGAMIVDIGGGTSEIAIISLGGIVVNRSLKIAGDEMDAAIIHYLRLRHGLLIGPTSAEDLKVKIGSAYKKNQKSPRLNRDKSQKSENKKIATTEGTEKITDNTESEDSVNSVVAGEKMAIVRGRDIETGLPRSIRVTETEVREALASIISRIIEEIADVLEEAPPELTSDILERGILLTGGAAQLPGLDSLIVERIHMPVILATDPLTTVVRGAGKVLEDTSLLSRVKVTGGLK